MWWFLLIPITLLIDSTLAKPAVAHWRAIFAALRVPLPAIPAASDMQPQLRLPHFFGAC